MAFIKHPGLPGRVYIPDADLITAPKHKCPDCFRCQMCPESRCRVCKNRKSADSTITDIIKDNQPGGGR